MHCAPTNVFLGGEHFPRGPCCSALNGNLVYVKRQAVPTAGQARVSVTVGRCGRTVSAATPTNQQAVFLHRTCVHVRASTYGVVCIVNGALLPIEVLHCESCVKSW